MPTTILDDETYEQAKHRRHWEEAEYAKRFQHTPGPWHIRKPLESNGYVWVNPMDGMCGEIATAWPISPGSAEANARLIAAAPDLLAALNAAKQLFDVALPKFNWAASALDADAIRILNEAPIAVNAAIAKALGDTLL